MSTEQIVRETAFAMWEADGCPDGRSEDYWFRAEKFVHDLPAASANAAKPRAAKPKKSAATATKTSVIND